MSNPRAERKGGPPDLERAFKYFVEKMLRGRSLDDAKDKEAKQGKFPDFGCFRDILLIEMKHFEADQRDRLNETYHSKVNAEEQPIFYGSRPIDFSKLSNGEEIKGAMVDKLAQTVQTHLRKANSQFRDYRSRNPRKNAVNVCVFLNSQLDEFSPEVVLHSIHRKMKASGDGPRYPYIDAVIYISEKHFQILADGRMAFAVSIYEGWGTIVAPWKDGFVNRLVEAWSHFRSGGGPIPGEYGGPGFSAIEDIPDEMARSDGWRLAYKRDPYLRGISKQRLIVYFNRCVALNSRAFIKGDWPKPPHAEIALGMQRFTEVLEEINARGMDMRAFNYSALSVEELVEVHRDLPAELVEMLSSRHKKPGEAE